MRLGHYARALWLSLGVSTAVSACGGMDPETEESEYLRVEVWGRFFNPKKSPPKVVWGTPRPLDDGTPADGRASGPSVVIIARQPGQSLWTTALCHEYAHIHLYQETGEDDRNHTRANVWGYMGQAPGLVPACESFLRLQESVPGGLPPGLMP